MSPSRGVSFRIAAVFLAASWALAMPSGALAVTKPTPPLFPSAKIVSSDGVTGTATISWSAPFDTGGASIGAYNITVTPPVTGSPHSTNGTTHSYNLAGFTIGVNYSVGITATNTYDMTSGPTYVNFKAVFRPNPPTNVGVVMMGMTSGKVSLKFSWKAPVHTGGMALTNYAATITPAGKKCIVTAANLSCGIGGFQPGDHLQVVVEAKNPQGWSFPSAALAFTVPTVADPPGGLAASVVSWQGSTATVDLTWTAPANNGGSGLQGYGVTSSSGVSKTVTGSTLSYEFTGMAPGIYTFAVVAKNGVGASSKAEITFTVPNAPTAAAAATASPTPAASPSPTTESTVAPAAPTSTATAGAVGGAPEGGSGMDPLLLIIGALVVAVAGLGGGLLMLLRRNAGANASPGDGSRTPGGAGGAA